MPDKKGGEDQRNVLKGQLKPKRQLNLDEMNQVVSLQLEVKTGWNAKVVRF